MTRYRIIVNPASGKGAAKQAIPQIHQYLDRLGLDYEIVQTERPWHAVELARQAVIDGFEVIVAAGGDGTTNEVINGLMQAKQQEDHGAALGVLCLGNGNDFAFGVQIPIQLAAGCQALVQNQRRQIDIGRVTGGDFPQGRYFGNGIGIGFDAVVGFEAAKLSHWHGMMAYTISALKTILLYPQGPVVNLQIDAQISQLQTLMISIMNGRRMGGGFLMAPDGQPDDGLFNLCIAHQVNRWRILTLIPEFMRGTQAAQEPVETAQGQRVVVTAVHGGLPVHADGETICEKGQEITVELLPAQLEVVYQPPDERA